MKLRCQSEDDATLSDVPSVLLGLRRCFDVSMFGIPCRSVLQPRIFLAAIESAMHRLQSHSRLKSGPTLLQRYSIFR